MCEAQPTANSQRPRANSQEPKCAEHGQQPRANSQEPTAIKGGIPRRSFSGVSIALAYDDSPVEDLSERTVEKLTQERLEELWKELAESCTDDEDMHSLIADKKVVATDENSFDIRVPNIYLDTKLRRFQDRILGFLRSKTGNDALKYKVSVETEKREAVAYMPKEKYEAMLQVNPAMMKLRKLFPDIDF